MLCFVSSDALFWALAQCRGGGVNTESGEDIIDLDGGYAGYDDSLVFPTLFGSAEY